MCVWCHNTLWRHIMFHLWMNCTMIYTGRQPSYRDNWNCTAVKSGPTSFWSILTHYFLFKYIVWSHMFISLLSLKFSLTLLIVCTISVVGSFHPTNLPDISFSYALTCSWFRDDSLEKMSIMLVRTYLNLKHLIHPQSFRSSVFFHMVPIKNYFHIKSIDLHMIYHRIQW